MNALFWITYPAHNLVLSTPILLLSLSSASEFLRWVDELPGLSALQGLYIRPLFHPSLAVLSGLSSYPITREFLMGPTTVNNRPIIQVSGACMPPFTTRALTLEEHGA